MTFKREKQKQYTDGLNKLRADLGKRFRNWDLWSRSQYSATSRNPSFLSFSAPTPRWASSPIRSTAEIGTRPGGRRSDSKTNSFSSRHSVTTTRKSNPDFLIVGAGAAGAKKRWAFPVEEQTWANHLLGTCRMGNDPKTSVVDKQHRAHDVRNLFLVDGSSFVTSGRGQPACTIQALAYWASDEIAKLAKRGEI